MTGREDPRATRTTVSLYPREYNDLAALRNLVRVKQGRRNMTLNDTVRYLLNVAREAGKP